MASPRMTEPLMPPDRGSTVSAAMKPAIIASASGTTAPGPAGNNQSRSQIGGYTMVRPIGSHGTVTHTFTP